MHGSCVSVHSWDLFDSLSKGAIPLIHVARPIYNWPKATSIMAPSTSKIATARLQLLQRVMETSPRAPFIRQYESTDIEAVMHIVSPPSHLLPPTNQNPNPPKFLKSLYETIAIS